MPAGKYSLSGEKREFITGAYDQHDEYATAIVTGAGLDTEHLTLRLAPNAIITGKILDEAGEPVRHANVTLYKDDHSQGVDQIRQFRGATTDDLGEYELTPLPPGTYFLSASAKPWYAVHPRGDSQNPSQDQQAAVDRSLDVAYPVTFYADVTDADSATPIPVRGGDRLQVDIHFTPSPALTVLFRLPDNGKRGFAVQAFQQPTFDSSTLVQTEVHGISNGLMAITGIPAGHYNVRISDGDRWLQIEGLDLSRDGQEIDTSTAEAVSRVKLSVKVAGESAMPAMLAVGLRPVKKTLGNLQIVDAKGETEFSQLAAGSYELIVRGSTTRYSVVHMTADGAQVSGHLLTISSGSSANASVTLVGGNVEVEGIAKKAGHPLAGAMVVLVPQDPEPNRDLFRRDQSDLDGTFTLHGVVPGSYTLLAIENGWDLDWSQPSVISVYLKRGRRIEVRDRSGQAMTVPEAIEVQSE
ncbi:MAG: carboxypeptidase-like regulatory domain-containing protein [Candidatus Sulfotelmatobacter sp.]